MQTGEAKRAFDGTVALVDAHSQVQQVGDEVGDLAAAVLEDLAFGLDILLKGRPGSLGAGVVGVRAWLVASVELPDRAGMAAGMADSGAVVVPFVVSVPRLRRVRAVGAQANPDRCRDIDLVRPSSIWASHAVGVIEGPAHDCPRAFLSTASSRGRRR